MYKSKISDFKKCYFLYITSKNNLIINFQGCNKITNLKNFSNIRLKRITYQN